MLSLQFNNENNQGTPINIEEVENASAEVVEETVKLDNSNIIRNISFDQSEILWNIMQLYNNGEPFEADMTASELKFYGKRPGYNYEIPTPKILMDVCPLRDDVIKITPFQRLPLEENSIKSLVFDPPFVISPRTCKSMLEDKKGSSMIAKRFASFYPVQQLYTNYAFWALEAYRVLDDKGIFVVKTQSTISGGINHSSEEWMFMCAYKAGFYCIDKFILEAKARLISAGKYKKQVHARRYTSVFYVFQKDDRIAKKFNYIDMIKDVDYEHLEGMVWEEK